MAQTPAPTPDPAPEQRLASLFGHAGLDVPDERLSTKLADYLPLLEVTAAAQFSPLGETPPATAFKADWK